jgi:hypothetical protein
MVFLLVPLSWRMAVPLRSLQSRPWQSCFEYHRLLVMVPTSPDPMARPEEDPTRALYGISVAAELVGSGPQNLRLYERRGLLEPFRTPGGTRRYSDADLDRLRRIGQLLDEGINLAGVKLVLDLEAANELLRAALAAVSEEA